MRQFLAIKLEHQRAVVNFVQVSINFINPLSLIHIYLAFPQRGFPIWFREFHIIKAFRLAKAAYNLLKPFLQERVKVRGQNTSYNRFNSNTCIILSL